MIACVDVAYRDVGAEPVALVTRGRSRTPLYITVAGIDVADAASKIKAMHGPYRIPTLLKRVDKLSRGHCDLISQE